MGIFTIKLPDIGEGIAEAELTGWNVAVGDTIQEDDVLAEVMTDKAAVEIPSEVSGTVIWLGGEPGDVISIGSDLIRIEVAGEGNTDAHADAVVEEAPKAPAAPVAKEAPAPTAEAPTLTVAPGKGLHLIKLPDIGEGIAEAELTGWSVAVGDMVQEDDILAEVMTDKAAVEIPADESGKVLWLNGEVGEDLAIGSQLVVLEVDGAGNITADQLHAVAAPPATKEAVEPQAPAPTVVKAASPAPRPAAPKPSSTPTNAPTVVRTKAMGDKPLAAPSVRGRARDLGIDLRQVPGSGPAGRITHDDLDHFHQNGGAAPAASNASPTRRQPKTGEKEEKIIGLRRKIAERMALSKSRIPHITIVEEVDMTELEEIRETLNKARAASKGKLTVLPFLMRAIVEAVAEQPQLNAHFEDDDNIMRLYDGVHIGIATQTPGGLVVPVVKHSEAMSLWQSAGEVSRLAQAAREGSAKREELSGSTITITSLGALGALATTPIINYPEVAIVGINKMEVRPHWDGDDFVPRKKMNISCSFDHRVIDGWDAAVFVQKLKSLLETPALLLLED